MGPGHALFAALGPDMAPLTGSHYAWWIRFPNLPAFVRLIAPILEQRVEQSVLAGYTGEFCIDFYRGGLRLDFAQGRLVTVEPWREPLWGASQAECPAPMRLVKYC